MKKETTCCFTGHRAIPQDQIHFLQKELLLTLENLVKNGYQNFCSGGALGFDLLAARTVLKLKERYTNISLSMILPCRNQDRFWNTAQKENYAEVLSEADIIIYTSEKYFKGCMYQRNRFLVDVSSCIVAFLEKNTGGTKYTVSYAEKKGIPVLFLDAFPEQMSLLS